MYQHPASRLCAFTRILPVLCALLLAAAVFGAPKNIILMIGDGMGPDSVYAAGAYKYGTAYHQFGGKELLVLETLAQQLYVTTYSADGKGYDATWNGGDREYVKRAATDSAAAATAMACGVKTYNAAIGVDMQKQPVASIIELAQQRGMKTGVISSVPFSHATPAAFAAHEANRNSYTAIAHDMLFEVQPDVVMGAGNPDVVPDGKGFTYLTKEDWGTLKAGKTPYQVIEAREDFVKLATNPATGKVFGLFRNVNCMTYCKADRKAADPALPTLAEMAAGTLATLDNPQGFVLMIEGGAIDWNNHANDIDGSIGETLAFDETVAIVLKWIAAHGGWEQNLLIITADHDTGYMNNVKATEAGKLPSVAWGTAGGKHGDHTNRMVPLFAQGAGSDVLLGFAKQVDDFERGNVQLLENTHIFQAMKANLPEKVAVPAN